MENYTHLSKSELLTKCKEHNVHICKSKTKNQILSVLQDRLKPLQPQLLEQNIILMQKN